MPITIGGSTDDRIGYMQPTLGGLTVDLDGTYTAPEDRVGSMNPTLGGLSINFDGVFAASASYDGDMTLTLDGLAMSWRGQFTAFSDFAPQFTSTPSVSFIQGTPDTYDMEAHWTDDGASTVTSSLTPTVSGAGLSYNGNTHILTYDGTDTGSTGSYTLTVQDAVNTVVSASFNVTVQDETNEFSTRKFQVSGSTGLSTETDKNTHFPVLRFTHTTSAETLDLMMYYVGGDTWEVNFGAWLPSGTSAAGSWTWTMLSGDAGLQGHANASGSLQVVAASHQGALMPHPTKKKFYFPQSGLPFLPYELRTVFFASDVSTANFTAAADFMQANNIPGIETQLTLENNFGFESNRNDWIYSNRASDIFDQTVWNRMQARMDILNERQLGAHVMHYSDDAGNPITELGYSTTQLLETAPKYAVARLAGYPYLMWNSGIDAWEITSQANWNTWADNVKSYDPYNHPISSRTDPALAPVTGETYASQIWPQQSTINSVGGYSMPSEYDGNTIVTGWDDAWGIRRSSHPSKNHTDDDAAIMMWKSLVVGGGHFLTRVGTEAGGVGNTAYDLANLAGTGGMTQFANATKYFKEFFDTYLGVDFLDMQRDNSYTSGTANIACAKVGSKVVVLAMRGSLTYDTGGGATCTLDLTGESGEWSVTKYNILTGEATTLENLSGGGSRVETLDSTTQSWVYFLSAEIQPSWNNTYTYLPTAYVGIPYGPYDLKDYGVDVENVYVIGTSRAYAEEMLPDGLTISDTGIISGTPTTVNDVAVLKVIGTNGTFDAAADWAYRSTLSGVNTTEDFPDNDSVFLTASAMSGDPDRSTWDTSTKLFGFGSNRQEILATSAYSPTEVDHAANMRRPILPYAGADGNFSDATEMNVGDEIWAMCTVKFNRVEAQWNFAGGNDVKIMMIDQYGGGASSFQATNQARLGSPRGFTGITPSIQWEEGLSTASKTTDQNFQPEIDNGNNFLTGVDPGLPSGNGAGSPWTACQQSRARYGGLYSYHTDGQTDLCGASDLADGIPDPLTGGVTIPIDYWISFMCHLRRDTSNTTLVEHYAALLGEDWTLMYSDVVPRGGGYSLMQLTNSYTGMTAEAGRPTAYRWYDGIITRSGSVRIPAPGFTS